MSNSWLFLSFLVAYFLGVFAYAFVAWRKLHEDYISSLFFAIAFKIAFISTIFALISHFLIRSRIAQSSVLNPNGLWFWGAVVGFICSLIYLQKKNHLRIYEIFDAFGMGLVWWYLIFLLPQILIFQSINNLVVVGGLIVTLGLYEFFQKNYRKFSWYKSGKVGFSVLLAIGIFFLFRSIIAITDLSVISFVGKLDSVLSASVAFLMFYSLYNLSQS